MQNHTASSRVRPYISRFLQVLPASAFLCFTFFFFGPYETVAFNVQSFSYHHSDVLVPLLAVSLIAALGLSLFSALLRGWLFSAMVSLVFSTALCFYAQAAFFNGGLGRLTGDAVDWAAQRPVMLISLMIWLLIYVLVFLLMQKKKTVWHAVVLYGSLLLIFMQSVPAVCIFLGLYENTHKSEIASYSLQTSGMYEFSKEKNVVVIVLDRLDNDYVEAVLASTPDIFDDFEGFTRYTNASSPFVETRPGLANILSGCSDLAYQVPSSVYFREGWTQGGRHILRDIRAQNCSIELYAYIEDLFSDPQMAMDYVMNLSDGSEKALSVPIVKRMIMLSLYRYAPIAVKPLFLKDTNYYNSDVYASDAYTFNDSKHGLGFKGIEATREQSSFKMIHFTGAHTPYYLTASGTGSDEPTSVHDQTKGCFNLLRIMFSRMKELGIYEETAIIITGDHGHSGTDLELLSDACFISLFYKPSGKSGTPIETCNAPVSNENIPATILKNLGADYSQYGKALDEVAENEIITRTCSKPLAFKDSDKYGINVYHITGEVSDFDNWKHADYYEIPPEYRFH